jgi:cyclohexa-1,5-dienecarbonyl-CoA hydratase
MLTKIEKQYTKIEVDIAPPAGRITLASPPANIIDLSMMDELQGAIEDFEQRDDISFLILAGNERTFSAGVDINAHRPKQARQMLAKFHSVIRALANTKKITVAAVRGACMGGGAELALVCDLIYCTEDSTWQFPEINLACFPPVAAVALSQVVGTKRAAELILTGQVIHGDEAFHFGLANDAVPDSELDDLLDEIGGRLASLSPAALALAKKAFYKFDVRQLGEPLQQVESIYVDELLKTEDALEGVNAFREKRKPVWKGK